MGLTSSIAECLEAEDTTFTSFYDPIVQGLMVSVAPIIDMVCIIIEADVELVATLPQLVTDFLVDLEAWIENPLLLIELAGYELPSPFNGFDISGEIEIDPEWALPQLEVTVGLMLIPLNIILGWCADIPGAELPSIPTLGDLELLIPDLGFQLPEAAFTCIAEIPLIPLKAVGDVITDPSSVC
tara:strand:- start:5630 stop:6181 length:552 start_codon:yes stop_codon:yes gene_type:complete